MGYPKKHNLNRKKEIWKKTNGVCAHCGKVISSNSMTVDHVIPKSHGGTDNTFNLMPLCRKCNMERMDMRIIPEDYYLYAHTWAIDDAIKYKKRWVGMRKTMI